METVKDYFLGLQNHCRWWSNQSVLKEINPEYTLEGLMLKLKHQYFGQLMQKADSLEKSLMLGNRGRDGWMALPTQLDMSLSKLWEMVMDREVWHATVHDVAMSWTWLSNWTTTILKNNNIICISTYKQHLNAQNWLNKNTGWTKGKNVYVCSVSQLCLALCDPIICSLPGSSVHGIMQARILERVTISSKESDVT